MRPQQFTILGVEIDALTPESAIDILRDLVVTRTPGYFVFCTVSTIITAQDDPALARSLAHATLVTPDGMPLVWLGRRAGVGDVDRVYGPDFMLDVFAATGAELSHYFFGGGPGVADAMVTRLRARFPDLRVAGTAAPPPGLDPTKVDDSVVGAIDAATPDVVWVGLGHPKQELWAHHHRPHLKAPVIACVGAAFDYHSGAKREAPRWMKRSGLQWLHRLASEPQRLWRRYLVGNSLFVYLLARERLGRHLLKRG